MDPFHHLNTSFSNSYQPLLSPSPPHHFPPLPPPPPPPPPAEVPDLPERERLPQWSHAETAAFLAIRADLDHDFLSTKRNKALWEAVSARLGAQGVFARTPDQCKSKWKNLVTRYKAIEAMVTQLENMQQQDGGGGDPGGGAAARGSFPFHDEMRRIFDARVERARALERKKVKGKDVRRHEQDDDGGEGDDGEDDEEEVELLEEEDEDRVEETRPGGGKKRRRKAAVARTTTAAVGGGIEGEVEAMLREFMRRQVEMEERWMEAAEARDAERRAREEEWRAAMVALGEERLALLRRWREREDAWRARAEEREERRHQLAAAVLAKLGSGTS